MGGGVDGRRAEGGGWRGEGVGRGALVSIQKPLVTYGFAFGGEISALRDF